MADVHNINSLSAHAAVLMRERAAKGCLIIVMESDGRVSVGITCDGATPADVQNALCEAIVENAVTAGRAMS